MLKDIILSDPSGGVGRYGGYYGRIEFTNQQIQGLNTVFWQNYGELCQIISEEDVSLILNFFQYKMGP